MTTQQPMMIINNIAVDAVDYVTYVLGAATTTDIERVAGQVTDSSYADADEAVAEIKAVAIGMGIIAAPPAAAKPFNPWSLNPAYELYDAETAERIGNATDAQVAASVAAKPDGIILIDADGDVVINGTWAAQQPGVRKAYVA